MDKLIKFQKNLTDEVTSGLLGNDHLIKDVKDTFGVNLDVKHAAEIRKSTLEHFSLLTKKAMIKANEEYKFNEHLEQLERLKEEHMLKPTTSEESTTSSVDLNESYEEITWPIRRKLLLEYEKKLKDYCENLQAELDKENAECLQIADGMELDK